MGAVPEGLGVVGRKEPASGPLAVVSPPQAAARNSVLSPGFQAHPLLTVKRNASRLSLFRILTAAALCIGGVHFPEYLYFFFFRPGNSLSVFPGSPTHLLNEPA